MKRANRMAAPRDETEKRKWIGRVVSTPLLDSHSYSRSMPIMGPWNEGYLLIVATFLVEAVSFECFVRAAAAARGILVNSTTTQRHNSAVFLFLDMVIFLVRGISVGGQCTVRDIL